MTYGWAILIIAVVLGALFQMGVFNSSSLTVRVPPGACKVLRTSAAVNLVGQCSGLLPKYVAQFDGQSSNIQTPNTPTPTNLLTASAWVYPVNAYGNRGIVGQSAGANDWMLKLRGTGYDFVVFAIADNNFGSVTLNNWQFITVTYNAGTVTAYVNGQQVGTFSEVATLNTGKILFLGYTPLDSAPLNFNGSISNVQVYNTSLDASQVLTLYQEGIGGAPVAPSNIVGWWPLNGDANDYSGNNNNGAPTAITFTAQYGK
jgi:hypothetical protein